MSKMSMMGCGAYVTIVGLLLAGCGLGDNGTKPIQSKDSPLIGKAAQAVQSAQAAQTPQPAPGMLTGSGPGIVQPLPLAAACIHRETDGNCLTPTADDADGDGFPAASDCNDHDPYTHPGAKEMKCNGVDEDCDGKDDCPLDRDHDGFSPPGDCDDNDARRNPRAVEIFCNGVDEDCNGVDDCDSDGDGESVPADCNDRDPTISRRAKEVMCDGIDQNCDGTDCCDNDEDGDGVPCRLDCDDRNAAIFPGAPIPPGCLRRDVNCDGVIDGMCH